MAHYVRWEGDWSHQQTAQLENASLYVFPISYDADGAADPVEIVQGWCDQLINGPSNGITAEPWLIPVVNKPLVLLAFTDFPIIRSTTTPDSGWGHIRERDAGIFAIVKLSWDGGAQSGLFVLNPHLWVDNPAGVIMGREIFGFPKILAKIGWKPARLEFCVNSLIFPTHSPDTLAENALVLSLRRSSFFMGLSVLFRQIKVRKVYPRTADPVEGTVQTIVNSILKEILGIGVELASIGGFNKIPVALLKQYRKAAPGTETCYQDVCKAEFSIKSISNFKIYPKAGFWLSPLWMWLCDHASLNLRTRLGLPEYTKLGPAVSIDCELELEGSDIT